jgi:hypothetical protein
MCELSLRERGEWTYDGGVLMMTCGACVWCDAGWVTGIVDC